MDTTVDYYISLAKKTKNKKRISDICKYLYKEISGYRLTAFKNPNTNLARICNREASRIEKQIKNIC